MITISQETDLDIQLFKQAFPDIEAQGALFIDIETTGFSSKHHIIYMIGCIYLENNTPIFKQYICEKPEDEYELLYVFANFIENYHNFIHFNGKSFDVPFIKTRLDLYHIKSTIDTIKEIDIYIDAKKIKKYLPTDNLKLKTVEKYFGYKRLDKNDGGTLIKVFEEFCKTHSKEQLEPLKLHNKEDLLGLYYTLKLYPIYTFIQCNKSSVVQNVSYKLTDDSLLLLIPYTENFTLTIEKTDCSISITNKTITIHIPLLRDTLKYYYKNYRDYYYLPLEDTVIHKSLATFVDKNHKEKATKENCFIKKRGTFIPLNPHTTYDGKVFQKDDDPKNYIEIDLANIIPENIALLKMESL